MKKILYSAAVAAIAFGMTACGGKKSEANETFEDESMEVVEETETMNEEVVTSEYTCTPATTEIEGPLGEYATVKDKTYSLVKDTGFGADSYNLNIDFDVKTAHTFTEPLEIMVTFYDEDGNLIEFPTESGSGYSVFSSLSTNFIQIALKKGEDCDATSVMIRYNEIKDFTPDMLKKIKTFKVQSKLDEGEEFNYEFYETL